MKAPHIVVASLVVALPALLLLPVWPLAGLGAGEDDVLYYYPARSFFHQEITAGRWPLMNPWTGLGRPVAADPQQALWYPGTWLFALLPPPAAYGLHLYGHYCLALLGTYRLLRSSGTGRPAALLGGIAFAFSGFLLAHRAHFAMQAAAAWTPWVFWRISGCVERGRWRDFGWAVLACALQVLAGHVQVAALTALGTLVWLAARGSPFSAARTCTSVFAAAPGGAAEPQPAGRGGPGDSPADRPPPLQRDGCSGVPKRVAALRWLGIWTAAGVLCAVQVLPTAAYLRACTRSERGFADFVENSWHPLAAVGWVLPLALGQRTPNFFEQPYWGPSHQCEQFTYAGILPLLLCAAGLRAGWRALQRRGWAVLLLFGLLLALGQYGPLCPPLYLLPGSSLFRVPARALLLVQLAVAALAAFSLDDLLRRVTPERVRLRAVLLRWTGSGLRTGVLLVAAPLALTALAALALPQPARGEVYAYLAPWRPAVLIPVLVIWLSLLALRYAVRHWSAPGARQTRSAARIAAVFIALLAADLAVIGWSLDVPPPAQRELLRYSLGDYLARPERELWTAALRQADAAQAAVQPAPQRLWVVTRRHNGVPGQYVEPLTKAAANFNVLLGIASLTDYGPLQPRALARAFTFKPWGESEARDALLADTRWTAAFGVRWILLCEPDLSPPVSCELVLVTPGGLRLYRTPETHWASVDGAAIVYQQQDAGAFRTTVDTPVGAGGSRLVVSQAAVPGWRACSDGQPLLLVADTPLLTVELPAGFAGAVEWRYTTPLLVEGAWISGAALLALLVLLLAPAWDQGFSKRLRRSASAASTSPSPSRSAIRSSSISGNRSA